MKRKLLWCLPALCFFMTNCTKEPLDNLTEEESRIYITNYDTAAHFNNYRTFSISDSVAVIQNNQLQGREQRSIDVQYVNALVAALQSRGYTRVGRDQNPDLGIAISRVTNTSSSHISYSDYGGYYGSYWDPYYWDYPGYDYYFPTYYGVYQSNETSLMIDAFDLKNSEQNNQIRDVWSGMIRGSGIFNSATAESQVNALFQQSPYFKFQ
ncbi:MAG TPA: DUF4136 domain-containing protein [Flavisolibacter sp.]|jgi:hypothetical protein|nr:DUF4136 domain-containing protein [Flavisolibacter sp.]